MSLHTITEPAMPPEVLSCQISCDNLHLKTDDPKHRQLAVTCRYHASFLANVCKASKKPCERENAYSRRIGDCRMRTGLRSCENYEFYESGHSTVSVTTPPFWARYSSEDYLLVVPPSFSLDV